MKTPNLQFEFSRSLIWGSMELPTTNTATAEQTDGAKAILVDFSDGLKALMAVPVCILSTWGYLGNMLHSSGLVIDI